MRKYKKIFNCALIILLLVYNPYLLFSQFVNKVTSPVDFVNPLIGTDSKRELSNGNTYPAIALPQGMNFWSPQTAKSGDSWFYTYASDKIRGFKQTHQASNWIGDYGQFAIMPVTGKIVFNDNERASWFSHKSEIVKPYYYSVYLAEHHVTTEIAPTERAAAFRFTYPETNNASVIIDALDNGSYVKVIPSENKIIGYNTKNAGGVPTNFKNYFVIQFDKPFDKTYIYNSKEIVPDVLEYEGQHAGAIIQFKTRRGEKVNAKVASSFISFEQAELNLKEIGKDGFDVVKEKAKATWNKELGIVQVEGATVEKLTTFYSCLYRSMLYPRKFYEISPKGEIVHYSPYNGKVLPGYMFTDSGFWDTFRAQFPLMTLLKPSLNRQIMEGLVNTYKESGWLPEWASPGHRTSMIGSNSASIIADVYLKGVRGYDINALYEGILKNSENEGPISSVGRKGVKYYNDMGYVPYDVGINENAARTLEYAYDDFTIYQLAKALNRPRKEVELFAKRSQNYHNLFDPSTSLMRGKNKDGKFQTPFNPFKWGDAFTEGNSWHYTWSVFHDIQGLVNLMGGKEKFGAKLDSVFTLLPVYDESYYGTVIHEIREMQIANMGQYAHGNQPIQHMIYLYNYAGEPWKTQYWAREVMDKLYKPTPDGYCGDEDNGQTSAWYIFSALGFYPVTPGTGQYVLGTPLFKKVTINLENGKKIVIHAENNSEKHKYIAGLSINHKPYPKNWLSHQELIKGAILDFKMSTVPNKSRGIENTAYPYSFTNK
ncbi:MAG: GH92 family glycosyl hydrolase [Daejeonella sp.]